MGAREGAEGIGGDNTRKKYAQIMAGTLRLNAVKGFEVGLGEGIDGQLYPRPPLLTSIPEKMRKLKK